MVEASFRSNKEMSSCKRPAVEFVFLERQRERHGTGGMKDKKGASRQEAGNAVVRGMCKAGET